MSGPSARELGWPIPDANVSAPTVTRLVGKLGFSGYSSFHDAVRAEVRARMFSPLDVYPSLSEVELLQMQEEQLKFSPSADPLARGAAEQPSSKIEHKKLRS